MVPDRPASIASFAEVAWSNDSGLGLHFLAIREDDLEILKAYLDKASNP
jgi:hypothetical protein